MARHASPKQQLANPHAKGMRNTLLVGLLLAILMTMFAIPSSAFARQVSDVGGGSGGADGVCYQSAQVNGTNTLVRNYTTCLPSGRWSQNAGAIMYRSDPAAAGFMGTGWASQLGSVLGRTWRLTLPSMLLQFTQICWNSALSLSQFAASFEPMDIAGAKIDAASKKLVDAFFDGVLPAVFMVVGVVAVLFAALKRNGQGKTIGKRILTSVVCLAALTSLGAAAGQTADASTPAKGSPWWVMKTLNTAVNRVTVGIGEMGKISDNENMMAYENDVSCQRYLWAMQRQYDNATTAVRQDNSSSITRTIDTLWQETALRSWVTMQYGNPSKGANTNPTVGKNAQMAYCHVLDMMVHENPAIQRQLTNTELKLETGVGSGINEDTAKWLFNVGTWIDPLDSSVKEGGAADPIERDEYTLATRASVFWETCTDAYNQNDQNDLPYREGWSLLTKNLSDKGSGQIENSGKVIRIKTGGDEFHSLSIPDSIKNVQDSTVSDAGESDKLTGGVCKAVFDNKLFQGDAEQNRGQAAVLGWYFDVPNVGDTWKEANVFDRLANPVSATNAAKTTIDYMYGNSDVDTLGAVGTLIGAIVNLIVWALFSVLLMISKLMLVVMGLFLVVAFMVQALPVGDTAAHALKGWMKTCLNMFLVGILYSMLGTLSVIVVSIIVDFCVNLPGSFIYNILAGSSPAFALLLIWMFFAMVLHRGSPFSMKSMLGLAGGGTLAAGVAAGMGLMRQIGKYQLMSRMMGNRGKGGKTGQPSAGGAPDGQNTAEANESEQISDKAADEQAMVGANGEPLLEGASPDELANPDGEVDKPRLGFGGLIDRKLGTANYEGVHRAASGWQAINDDAQQRRDEKDERMRNYRAEYKQARPFKEDGKISEIEWERRADRYAAIRNGAHVAKDGIKNTFRRAGVAAAVAGAAVWSQRKRIRTVATAMAHMAPKAAGVALTAAALSNPITAPAGVLMAGAMVARNARGVARGAHNAARELSQAYETSAVKGWAEEQSAKAMGAISNARQNAREFVDDALRHDMQSTAIKDGVNEVGREMRWEKQDETKAAARAARDARRAAEDEQVAARRAAGRSDNRSILKQMAQSSVVRNLQDRASGARDTASQFARDTIAGAAQASHEAKQAFNQHVSGTGSYEETRQRANAAARYARAAMAGTVKPSVSTDVTVHRPQPQPVDAPQVTAPPARPAEPQPQPEPEPPVVQVLDKETGEWIDL